MTRWVSAALGVALGAGVLAACSSTTANTSGPQCGATATLCGDSCAELATDNANCGACGTACAAGQLCSKGVCASSCGGGTTQCGSTCNDTKVDPNNCGACGTKCTAGQVCSAGKCASSCAQGQTSCGAACVNTATDNANCGACGTVCGAGQVCSAGKCALSCQQGLSLCSMSQADAGAPDASSDASVADAGGLAFPYCANLQSDDSNCGGCGVTCGGGSQCQNGACTTSCGAGQTLCAGQDGGASYCASFQSDNQNCGACGKVCAGSLTCVGGTCKPAKFAFQLTQTIDGQAVTCSAVNNSNPLYTECDDLKENNMYFPNGITCGPAWSMTNSSYSDTVGFCQSLTGTAKMEAYYACTGTVPRTTWKNHVWGTFNDNGYTQNVRCYY